MDPPRRRHSTKSPRDPSLASLSPSLVFSIRPTRAHPIQILSRLRPAPLFPGPSLLSLSCASTRPRSSSRGAPIPQRQAPLHLPVFPVRATQAATADEHRRPSSSSCFPSLSLSHGGLSPSQERAGARPCSMPPSSYCFASSTPWPPEAPCPSPWMAAMDALALLRVNRSAVARSSRRIREAAVRDPVCLPCITPHRRAPHRRRPRPFLPRIRLDPPPPPATALPGRIPPPRCRQASSPPLLCFLTNRAARSPARPRSR